MTRLSLTLIMQSEHHVSQRPQEVASDSTDAQSRDQVLQKKTIEIRHACISRDVPQLKSLAESRGGFLTDELRRLAWPILLGVSKSAAQRDKANRATEGEWKQLPRHKDEDQVQLDVNRAFIYYPTKLDERKSELYSLIVEVLRRYPFLCYFQGYHDICQVFLLVLEPRLRAEVVARLSVLRIRDFMLPSLAPTTAQLRLLPDILAKADPELRRHVASIEPFYALAGTLTMYAHNIEAYQDIVRLFDIFLAREPVFTVYIFAQIVIDRRLEILEVDDVDILTVVLSKIPPQMDLDALIIRAAQLFERFPPEALRFWNHISSSSALKTARHIEDSADQTMEEGHQYFLQQANELHWSELQEKIKMTIWVYRKPARAIGMAVAVGLVAIYLRKNPTLMHHLYSFFRRS
ncbi:TBC1 domain family member 20 [Paramyrothecium foliicola]|nr:TBC1 domain family member 20 [Paramyrothecium foliicola]